MILGGTRSALVLFIGDLVALAASLYVALWLRTGNAPTLTSLTPYEFPFLFLFALWTLVFFASGLYGKRIIYFPSRFPDALVKTQLANMLLAIAFFFTVPVGIAPKTILVLYFFVSIVLIAVWRLALYPRFSRRGTRVRAILRAQGPEAEELFHEVNNNPRYAIEFCSRELDVPADMIVVAAGEGMSFERLARYGGLVVTFEDVYEEVFDRVPLSSVGRDWFGERMAQDSIGYVIAKRAIDIVGGLCMGLVTLIVAPLIALANRFDSPGPLFIAQERFGRDGSSMRAYKFRSMRQNKSASSEWTTEEQAQNPITRVGAFLRKTSLDEFPQCINVLRGDLSLVGPRNDIEGLGRRLADAIPYYLMRYSVTPGITGWAQINQQYEPGNASPQSVDETKTRLAYDFYYIKHRSLMLDIIIALKTIKRMLFRVSSW